MEENNELSFIYEKFSDRLINIITSKSLEVMSRIVEVKDAVVQSVNTNNTVNVSFTDNLFEDEEMSTSTFNVSTINIPNQSIYQNLNVGDVVLVLIPDGSLSRAWILGVHNNKKKENIKQYVDNKYGKKIEQLTNTCNQLLSQNLELKSQIKEIKSQINT